MKKTLLSLLFLICTGAPALFACCSAERHTLTELLLHDERNRSVFLCRVIYTAATIHGGYFSKGKVLEVFKGEVDLDTVFIYTGGNTSAGGRQTELNSEWLIFSEKEKNGEYFATVCDPFSCSNADQSEYFPNKFQLVADFKQKRETAYSGPIVWYYHDGVKAAEGNFLNGKPEGKWKHYRYDGTLKSETLYKNGLRHGEALEIMEHERGTNLSLYQNGALIQQITRYTNFPKLFKSEQTVLENPTGLKWMHTRTWYPNQMLSLDYYQKTLHLPSCVGGSQTYYEGAYLKLDSTGKVLTKGEYYLGAKIGQWIETKHSTQEQIEVNYPKPSLPGYDFVRFFEDGKPAVMGNLKNGKPEGKWLFYSSKGYLFREANFAAGELSGEVLQFFYQSEQVYERNHYADGKQEGEQLRYFEDGAIQEQYFCHKGIKQGANITYLKPDVWLIKSNFLNGKIQGEYLSRDTKGDTLLVANFQEDALSGSAIEYYRRSKTCRKSVGQYQNGFKTGEWNTYDCEGKLLEKCLFEGVYAQSSSYNDQYGGRCTKEE